jgi:nucleotide-binding universal stress UspA family protein
MLERYLVACDFSEDSKSALAQALAVAHLTHPKSFVVATVLVDFHKAFIEMPAQARREIFAGDMEKFQRELRAESEARLDVLLNDFDVGDTPLRKEVILGKPYIALIGAALKEKHDIVFVGTRGVGGLKGFFLGSTARQLVRNCPSAVWVSKGMERSAPRVILVPVDFSETSRRALDVAKKFSLQLKADLHVMHIIDDDDIPVDLLEINKGNDASPPSWRTLIEDKAKSQLDEFVKANLGSNASKQHTVWGTPWEEVGKCAKKIHADLVVMGTVGRRGFSRLLLGNTAEKVLESCETSILSVKPADFISPIDEPFWSLHPGDKK